MPLEAVVVCLDNSEHNRNGDFAPSRWDSQQDAATNICDVKINQNPENSLGIVAMAGKRVDVKLTQTNDIGVLLNAINSVEINGSADFFTSIKVAQLSLKHRMNKMQKSRIIVFVGHPLEQDVAEFEELGIRLRRNAVNIDVINFANPDNVAKLTALVNAANDNNQSHFLDVPMGVAMITDVLITSPIFNSEDGAMNMNNGGNANMEGVVNNDNQMNNQFSEFGGVNPDLDPEMAMVLKMSLEEERNRQKDENKEAKPDDEAANNNTNNAQADAQMTSENKPADAQQTSSSVPVTVPEGEAEQEDEEEFDEEYYLQQAIKLSMQEGNEQEQKDATDGQKPQENQTDAQKEQKPAAEPQADLKDIVTTDFMKDIIAEMQLDIDASQMSNILDSVNQNDANLTEEEKKKKEEEEQKKKEEKKE